LRKKWIIPVVIAISLVFNFGYALTYQSGESQSWLFPDLGPAVMQDSYYIRAPGLESPYGMIGDIPGGYSLYYGNPLHSDLFDNYSIAIGTLDWHYGVPAPDLSMIFLAIIFAAVPVTLIIILGRRSYGSTKTQ
jgi:hypothetical protein